MVGVVSGVIIWWSLWSSLAGWGSWRLRGLQVVRGICVGLVPRRARESDNRLPISMQMGIES